VLQVQNQAGANGEGDAGGVRHQHPPLTPQGGRAGAGARRQALQRRRQGPPVRNGNAGPDERQHGHQRAAAAARLPGRHPGRLQQRGLHGGRHAHLHAPPHAPTPLLVVAQALLIIVQFSGRASAATSGEIVKGM